MPRLALSLPALLLPALLAAACTTVPPEQRAAACRATDWSSYGYNDGRLGVSAADRAGKFADCAELGHPADTAAYQAGRARGLAEYCNVESGYEVGIAGRPYHKVCPPELEPGFLQGFEQGRKERPVHVYPYVGFGFGYYSHPFWFGHRHYYHPHRHHHRPRRGEPRGDTESE
jgi:hypothetical protein